MVVRPYGVGSMTFAVAAEAKKRIQEWSQNESRSKRVRQSIQVNRERERASLLNRRLGPRLSANFDGLGYCASPFLPRILWSIGRKASKWFQRDLSFICKCGTNCLGYTVGAPLRCLNRFTRRSRYEILMNAIERFALLEFKRIDRSVQFDQWSPIFNRSPPLLQKTN